MKQNMVDKWFLIAYSVAAVVYVYFLRYGVYTALTGEYDLCWKIGMIILAIIFGIWLMFSIINCVTSSPD